MKHLVAQPHILMSVQDPYHPTSSEISHEDAIGILSGNGKYNNVHSAKGKYGNIQDTIFISNPSEAQVALAHKIAEETGQDSLIESDGHSHKMIITNGPDKGSVTYGKGTTWHEQEPEDCYTTLPTGEHFTHNFDEVNQDVQKSEDLEKSKNVREQRAKVFGTDPNAPRISNKRMKMMQAIQGYAQKKYGLPLVTASGKRDVSGQLKEEKGIEQQPYDVFTPQGLAEEKARQEKVKQLGLKRVDPKPDWRSGNIETQPSPDAAVHDLAHLDLAPEGVTAPEMQDLMDRKWGESQKKYGHMQQKKIQGEIQPMALENPLRRELGLPANRTTKPVTENQTALDDPNQQRFVQGKDSKGRPAFYDRQSRLMNPETRERLTQIREGSVKFDPKGGWQPSSDVNALINLRGRGMAGEAQRRAKQKFSSSAQAPQQSSVPSIDDLLSHQGSVDELKQKIAAFAQAQPKKLASSEQMSKAEQLRKRCWEGYKPVPGKKPYSKGSCAPIKKNHINKNESTRQPSAIKPEPETGEHPFLEHVTKKYGYHDEHPVKKFFKEWVDTTQEHPFVPHRIHGFENPENPESPIFAFSNLKPDYYNPQTTVLIDWLQSDEKGSGAGSQALKEITDLADKHGVNLSLIAGASPSAPIKTTAPSRLKRFYGRHGFQSKVSKNPYMVRPANAGQITKSDQYIFHPEDEDAIHELFTDSSEKLEMAEKPFHGYNKEKHSKTGGLSDKYREKYNRETGSNLKRPVTGKVKAGSKAAGRRKSFCARMSGVKGPTSKEGKLTPKGAALKRWKCSKSEELEKGKLEHYSSQQGLKTIDPKFKGRGVDIRTKGRDTEHPHSFFYRAGTLPEDVVASGAKSKYTVEIPDNAPLYDLATDNQGHIASAIEQNQGALNMDMVHQNLKDAGYQGFYNSAHPQLSNVVALYHEQPVSEEHEVQKQEGTDCDDHLDPLKKPYASEAQRRWAHTPAGKKALGGEKAVAHWDKATRGKDLPEKVGKSLMFQDPWDQAKHDREHLDSEIDDIKKTEIASPNGAIADAQRFNKDTDFYLGRATTLFRHYKHSPHHPISLGLKYLIHRIENNKAYENAAPEQANQMDSDFLNLHQSGAAKQKNGDIKAEDLQHFYNNFGQELIPQLNEHKQKLRDSILNNFPSTVVNIDGKPHVALTRGLNTEKPLEDHALSSYADKPHTGFGKIMHHRFVPLDNLWYSYELGYKSATSADFGNENEYLVSPHKIVPAEERDVKEIAGNGGLFHGYKSVEELVNDGHWSFRHAMAKLPDLHPKFHEKLVNDDNWAVRHAMAKRPDLHSKFHEKLANDRDEDVCSAMASNPSYIGNTKLAASEKFNVQYFHKSEPEKVKKKDFSVNSLEKVSREEVAQSHILMFPVSINGQHKDEHENIPDYHITLKWMGNNPHKTPEEIQNIVQKHGLTPPESFDLHPHIFNTPNGPAHVLLLNGNLDSLHNAKREIDIGNPDRYPSYLPHITVSKKIHDAVKEHGLTAKDLNIQVHPLEYRVGEQTIKRYE